MLSRIWKIVYVQNAGKRLREPLRNMATTMATWTAAGAIHRIDCNTGCEDICFTFCNRQSYPVCHGRGDSIALIPTVLNNYFLAVFPAIFVRRDHRTAGNTTGSAYRRPSELPCLRQPASELLLPKTNQPGRLQARWTSRGAFSWEGLPLVIGIQQRHGV